MGWLAVKIGLGLLGLGQLAKANKQAKKAQDAAGQESPEKMEVTGNKK